MAVAIGSTAQGDVANASDTNYFKVQVVAGQKYTFQTVLGSLYASVLTLLGTNGQTVIAQNDGMAPGNRASSITWQATASGTYYLAVSSFPGSPLGTFTLATQRVSPLIRRLRHAPGSALATARTKACPGRAQPCPDRQPNAGCRGESDGSSVEQQSVRVARLSYSATAANSNAVSVVVYGNQLTIRAAANFAGSVQIAVTASSGGATAVQSFNVTITSPQPSGGQPGGSVAIPSATLPSAAAAVVFSSNSNGAATSSASNSSRGLNPAALDTCFANWGVDRAVAAIWSAGRAPRLRGRSRFSAVNDRVCGRADENAWIRCN